MDKTCCIILAAGDGKRMKSKRPKVLCEVLFKPMLSWVINACEDSGIDNGCVIVGEGSEYIEPILPATYQIRPQNHRLGTGHAVSMAAGYISDGGFREVLVLCGDMPLIDHRDLAASLAAHREGNHSVTVFGADMRNPHGYGRLVRENGLFSRIVEEKDADAHIKEIKLINAGTYWFNSEFLLEFFNNMKNDNSQGEYYLTDAVGYAAETGRATGIFHVSEQSSIGANDRASLASLNEAARNMIISGHLENGVSIPFRDGIVIGPDVKIGPDATILPGSILKGATIVGSDCEIGPNSHLDNAVVEDGCKIVATYIDRSTVRAGARIGPMCNIRPDCDIGPGVKIGDFVEVKNSTVGEGTSLAHLTYIGDSDIGGGCNFGCGVVTVNYDGQNKFRTKVGDDSFIGCNVNLIAPVALGERVYAAAGTTVTKDVPNDALVIGRARETVKDDWMKKRRLFKKKK